MLFGCVIFVSMEWEIVGKKQEIKVDLERFENTPLEEELNRIYGREGEESLLYRDIERTYKKYLFELGNENVTVVTNLLEPQVYKVGMHEIKIVNKCDNI